MNNNNGYCIDNLNERFFPICNNNRSKWLKYYCDNYDIIVSK